MRALVLYESLFGNTEVVARAVADGVRVARPDAVVDCRRVDDPPAPAEVDLLAAEPETFLVEAVAGPLRTGEVERARDWGTALARALDRQDTTNWRTTMERHDTDLLTAAREAPVDRATTTAPSPAAAPRPDSDSCRRPAASEVTRIVTTAEVVVGAVLVARYLSRRPGSSKALVTMGPGGWVSMKGGTVALRRGSRWWARPTPVRPTSTGERVPLWARVLSAVPLQALMR